MSASAQAEGPGDVAARLREVEAALETTRAELRRVRGSTSYRLGRRIVRTVRGPAEAGRRILSAVVRWVVRLTPQRWRSAMPEPVQHALDAVVGARPDTTEPQSFAAVQPLVDRPEVGVLGPRTATQGPVQMFVVIGLDQVERERVVDEVAALRDPVGGFVPVFVTDDADFSSYRTRGLPFEYVTPAHEWAAAGVLVDYPEYLDRRVRGIVDHYAPRHVFVLSDGARDLLALRADLWPFLAPTRSGAA